MSKSDEVYAGCRNAWVIVLESTASSSVAAILEEGYDKEEAENVVINAAIEAFGHFCEARGVGYEIEQGGDLDVGDLEFEIEPDEGGPE